MGRGVLNFSWGVWGGGQTDSEGPLAGKKQAGAAREEPRRSASKCRRQVGGQSGVLKVHCKSILREQSVQLERDLVFSNASCL